MIEVKVEDLKPGDVFVSDDYTFVVKIGNIKKPYPVVSVIIATLHMMPDGEPFISDTRTFIPGTILTCAHRLSKCPPEGSRWEDWKTLIIPEDVSWIKPVKLRCTCGAAKCGSKIHSSWCDLA